jgi:hypothetical protein
MSRAGDRRGEGKRISKVEPTDERITGRGGMTLFVRYIDQIKVIPNLLLPRFGSLRKNRKGVPVESLLKQIFCFLLDGTSRHLTYFDALQKDRGYAAAIETAPRHMVSSHGVKRFFQSFSWPLVWICRRILLELFLWRLQISQPEIILIDIDVMGMDNNEADKREGVMPTYKKYKGFGPLQMTWEGFIIDTVFRSGDKHSNHGHGTQRMMRRVVHWIRGRYRKNVPIVFHLDSGYMDQKLFEAMESWDVGYVCGGKLYPDIVDGVRQMPQKAWGSYVGREEIEDGGVWEYVEFGDRRSSWKRFRRALFTRPVTEDDQLLLSFARPCAVLYSNLGMGYGIDEQLRKAGFDAMLTPEGIIGCYHHRGRSELTFRVFKEFADQRLPFQRLRPNAAFYSLICIAFFLYEAFKEDVCGEVVPITSYPNTLRRKVIDIAAKIVSGGETLRLKVSRAAWASLNFARLWAKSNMAPCIRLQ